MELAEVYDFILSPSELGVSRACLYVVVAKHRKFSELLIVVIMTVDSRQHKLKTMFEF